MIGGRPTTREGPRREDEAGQVVNEVEELRARHIQSRERSQRLPMGGSRNQNRILLRQVSLDILIDLAAGRHNASKGQIDPRPGNLFAAGQGVLPHGLCIAGHHQEAPVR